jgi:hypothetical protein
MAALIVIIAVCIVVITDLPLATVEFKCCAVRAVTFDKELTAHCIDTTITTFSERNEQD